MTRWTSCCALVLVLLMGVLPARSRAQGVVFEAGPFAEVLRRAYAQRKMVFVHFTNSQTLAGRHADTLLTFPEPARLLAGRALAYRVDVSAPGDDQPLVSKYAPQRNIVGVFLNGQGQLLHRYEGVRSAGLHWDVRDALDEFDDFKPLSVWEQEYPRHRRDPVFLYGYLRKRMRSSRPDDGTLLEAYLRYATPAQLTADYSLDLLLAADYTTRSRAFELLMQYRDRAAALYGETGELVVWAALRRALDGSLAQAAFGNRPRLLREVLRNHERLRRISPFVTNWSDEYLRLRYLALNGSLGPRNPRFETQARQYLERDVMGLDPADLYRRDSAELARFRTPYLRGERDSTRDEPGYRGGCEFWRNPHARRYADELTLAASYLLDRAPDRAQTTLVTALGWAGRAAQLDPTSARLMLYGHLLRRTGRADEALRIMQQAAALARREGLAPPTRQGIEREINYLQHTTGGASKGKSGPSAALPKEKHD
jgi:hypothetical protein